MVGSLNKVTLIGNLGRDPEFRTMQNGGKVATFPVATTDTWKDSRTGERQERTQWHQVVVFNEALIKIAQQFLKKGVKVYLEGQNETRKYQDGRGADRSVTEVVLRQFRGELIVLDASDRDQRAQYQERGIVDHGDGHHHSCGGEDVYGEGESLSHHASGHQAPRGTGGGERGHQARQISRGGTRPGVEDGSGFGKGKIPF